MSKIIEQLRRMMAFWPLLLAAGVIGCTFVGIQVKQDALISDVAQIKSELRENTAQVSKLTGQFEMLLIKTLSKRDDASGQQAIR